MDIAETEGARWTRHFLDKISNDPNIHLKLESLRSELGEKPEIYGETPNPITVYRLYIDRNFVRLFVNSAEKALVNGRADGIPLFAARFDLWLGGIAVIEALHNATRNESPEERQTRAEQGEKRTLEVFGSTGSRQENLDFMENIARGSQQLLKEDPTGFSLADEVVMQLKASGSDLYTFENRDLVVKGAEFARDAYKALYRRSKENQINSQ